MASLAKVAADTTEVITVTDQELLQLNKGRERIFERSPVSLDAENVLQRHGRCSLIVCNTVQRAQETYLKLHETIEQRGLEIELHLLHSRFIDEDRQRQGEQLRQMLGKEQWQAGKYQGKNVIIVATQVVEVGLDISVQTLHTEIAPANSLIQRAGRCARFARQKGLVIVYPLPLDKEIGQSVSSLPYDATLCSETWDALAAFEGRHMGLREEQQLVDLVHTPGDLDLLKRYEGHRFELQQTITRSLQTNQRGDVTELIRDVTQVQLLVHNYPQGQIQTEPWRWQSFGIHPSLLQGKHWDRLLKHGKAIDADQMEHFYHRAREEQLPLCSSCQKFNVNRINADGDFLKGTKGIKDAEFIDQLLQRCAMDDVGGILVTEEKQG